MAVGAGSIKRAAKAKVEPADKKAEVKATEAKETVNKTVEKAKPETKKAVTKKTEATKKSAVKITVKADVEKTPEVKVQKNEINQVCHLTEELPIHLL